MHKGDNVILRFPTVDVTHSFYIPELRLGPVFIDAGHLYVVPFKADTTGILTYYCTSVCGHCHFYMQGKFIITFIPELATLANKLKIPDKETADSIIKLLAINADFDKLADHPPFPTYSRFLAQYNSINRKILDGANILQKADSTGPVPPLCMPSWEYYLSREEINAILAYLISQNKWEE